MLTDGTKKGGVNRDGVMYYNNLINELIKNGNEMLHISLAAPFSS